MAETLGSLCDKLTIVKLKQWHSKGPARLKNLNMQAKQLQDEIDQFIQEAGRVPLERLTFAANKVYKKAGNAVSDIKGSLGKVFSQLAQVNCKLWHNQEKIYEFQKVPAAKKDAIINQLARLNLERNKCIDRIDQQFRSSIEKLRSSQTKSKQR